MDYEEFKKKVEAQRAESFASFQKSFNDEMKKRGSTKTLDDVLGSGPLDKGAVEIVKSAAEMPPWDGDKIEQLVDLYLDIYAETTDEDPRDLVLRALAVYRSFVKHARAGGQVKFVGCGAEKTLKVRLR